MARTEGRGKNKYGLTPEQERFAKARAAGKSQRDAYTASHPDSTASNSSKDSMGCIMERNALIRKRIADIQARVDQGLILSIEQIQSTISDMVQDDTRPDAIRLKAADQLTRMRGGYKDSVSVSGTVSIDDRRGALSDLVGDA